MPSNLTPVTPLRCQTNLSSAEFMRVITQLCERDRQLEYSLQNFMSESDLADTVSLLNALQTVIGKSFLTQVADTGALPEGVSDFITLQNMINDRLAALEGQATIPNVDGTERSLKAVVQSAEATLADVLASIDSFTAQLDSMKEITSDIQAIKATVDSTNTRMSDSEKLLADVSGEVKSARKEFSKDNSKRLIDKIDALDGQIKSAATNVAAIKKELADARASDRFDSLAERLGDLESKLNGFADTLSALSGRGSVNGMKVGRSILHGNVELIPGSNIAITREKNGYRIDVVDRATCIDMSAPIGDPNSACCGPNSVIVGN